MKTPRISGRVPRRFALASTVVLLGISSIAVAGPAAAAAAAARTAPTTGDRCDVATVKSHVEAAIDRRLTLLGALTTRVGSAKGLTASDRSTLQSQLADEKTGLTALRGHVEADADCPSLRTDARKVVDDYRVYLLMAPKVHLVIAADSITAVTNSAKLADAMTKLQAGIDKKKGQGKDMSHAQAALDDMKAKVDAARSAVAGVSSSVIVLEPHGYPGNKPTLEAGRTSVRAGRENLRAARADARAVIADLKAA